MDVQNLSLSKLTFVDVETPNRASNSICEISILVYEDGKPVEEISELINPQAEFQKLNMDIHGIHPEDVEDKDTFDIFFEKYGKYFEEDYILIGHNIRSDINILQKDLARYDKILASKWCIDTQDIARDYLYKDSIPKGGMALGSVCEKLKIGLDAHNAKSDAAACVKIIDRFKDEAGFDLHKYVQDATTSKTKQRKELAARAASLEPGTELIYTGLGKVRLIEADENHVVVEKDGLQLTLRSPVCFLKRQLRFISDQESENEPAC